MTKGYPDWLRAFLLLGKHDSSYLPVLLGPDGSLYCVLQGEHEGALRTVQLDDQGRLSAFVVDNLDAWGNMLKIGNTELVARLWSPVTYDRRGQVVWMDVCDKGLNPYIITGSGTGNHPITSTLYPLHGHYTLKLIAGSNDLHKSELRKIMSPIGMLRSGLEVAAYMLTPGESFGLEIWHTTGTQEAQARLLVVFADNTLQYYGSDGNNHTFATIGVPNDPYGIYHHIKLVVDYESGTYVRALYDDTEYDLSGTSLHVAPSVELPHYTDVVKWIGRAGYNDIAHIGHMIITTQEP